MSMREREFFENRALPADHPVRLKDLRFASAKAVGMKTHISNDGKVLVWTRAIRGWFVWEPDTDPAQALELMDQLHIDIEWSVGGMVTASKFDVHGTCLAKAQAENAQAAITLAAAQLVK